MDFLNPSADYANPPSVNKDEAPQPPIVTATPTAAPFTSSRPDHNRWHLSAWTLWRPHRTNSANTASIGQLGASQTGARLDLDLTTGTQHRFTAYTRVTAALTHPVAPEAALGIAYQPIRPLPVSLALERRIALGEGARDAMALLAIGGFGPTPIVPGLLAEAYGQTGIVGFRAGDRFVDGRISVFTPIERLPLRVGASLSGGAQPSVHRVDIGPEIQIGLPLPAAPGRLSIEWRQRIAGLVRPTSGLAVTLAADF
jgi:hypothetical protein